MPSTGHVIGQSAFEAILIGDISKIIKNGHIYVYVAPPDSGNSDYHLGTNPPDPHFRSIIFRQNKDGISLIVEFNERGSSKKGYTHTLKGADVVSLYKEVERKAAEDKNMAEDAIRALFKQATSAEGIEGLRIEIMEDRGIDSSRNLAPASIFHFNPKVFVLSPVDKRNAARLLLAVRYGMAGACVGEFTALGTKTQLVFAETDSLKKILDNINKSCAEAKKNALERVIHLLETSSMAELRLRRDGDSPILIQCILNNFIVDLSSTPQGYKLCYRSLIRDGVEESLSGGKAQHVFQAVMDRIKNAGEKAKQAVKNLSLEDLGDLSFRPIEPGEGSSGFEKNISLKLEGNEVAAKLRMHRRETVYGGAKAIQYQLSVVISHGALSLQAEVEPELLRAFSERYESALSLAQNQK